MNSTYFLKIRGTMMTLAAVGLFAIGAFAQSNTGTITGVITDPNGAVVPNAAVTVTNQGTAEKRNVQADSQGSYQVPSLPTGIYTVEAVAASFKSSAKKDISLSVGDRARIDITLGLSDVDAVVTVSDETRVDTETSTLGDTISTARINQNPVNGRDFTQLLATIPGSVQTTNVFQTTINGIPSSFGGASVLVDGIDASRVDVNGTSNVLGRIESRVNRVSMDSIQEVQVVEQNYSAEYGQALGAVINPITKSGTNDFHGSVFDFFRHEGMDAPDALAGKQRFRLNQFGGNVSGPIKKDRAFFFANYEGVRQTRGQTFSVLTPTAAYRASMNATIRPVVEDLPLPQTNTSSVAGFGSYMGQRIGKLREDTGSVKIDWLHSDKGQFSVRYNINDSDTDVPFGVGTSQMANGKLRVQLFKVAHNYTFNATTTNEFGFGINHNYTYAGAGRSTLPRFDMTFVDYRIATPGPAQFEQERTGAVYQFLDTLTMIRGDHALKFGADLRLNRRDAMSVTQDTLTFFSASDFANNAPFVIARSGNPKLSYANENYSFFVNDDWKAHPRLSLNLGLRYEVSSVSREKNGLLQNFDLATMTVTPVGSKLYNADKNNFGPRVGFAIDVFGTHKTVIRGGYGIFYNRELPASFGSPAINSFPSYSVDLFQALFCPTPPATFQYPVDPAIFRCGVPNVMVIEKNMKTAMAQQYSLNVQQDVGFGVLTVGYVGNHTTHILTDGVITPRNINRKDPVSGVRPLSANVGDIFVVGGYPQANYNGLQINFKRNARVLRLNANYTWSHAIDDVVGFFKDYQDPNNMRAERASSDQDVRHNFSLDAGVDLQFRKWFKGGKRWIADGWSINTITQIRSGFPVTVTRTGGIFSGFSFRPNAVPGADPYCSPYQVPGCQFNAAAFSDPGPGVFGNVGRNTLRGPNFAQVDVSFAKDTRFSDRHSLQLRLDVFNILNRANYADPSGGISCGGSVGACGGFGVSTSTVGNQLGGLLGFGGPRQIQLSARFNF
ncbi:MAG: TonB-dependent receptor [Chloracidobacterium sp.]|nr:TonB-dependent receptor [Chloracidobacterium sp.]MCO5332718.1 TonB-dependent receptor [Pyrinomonadaceae bacterium]